MRSPWDDLQLRRPCVVTSDQDWAPEWAVVALLEFAASLDLRLHVFRTNPSPALDKAVDAGVITQGWHPNFRPHSSHGPTPSDVISSMLKIAGKPFPSARRPARPYMGGLPVVAMNSLG